MTARKLFGPFIKPGGTFANRRPGPWRGNPWRRQRWRFPSRNYMRIGREINATSRLAARRKQLPENPLYVHLMAVEDAVKPRYRPH